MDLVNRTLEAFTKDTKWDQKGPQRNLPQSPLLRMPPRSNTDLRAHGRCLNDNMEPKGRRGHTAGTGPITRLSLRPTLQVTRPYMSVLQGHPQAQHTGRMESEGAAVCQARWGHRRQRRVGALPPNHLLGQPRQGSGQLVSDVLGQVLDPRSEGYQHKAVLASAAHPCLQVLRQHMAVSL